MNGDARADSLQLEQDPAAQRCEWAFERAGWAVLAVLLLAGLLGAFGQGPVAHAVLASPDGRVTVRYDRILRVGAPSALAVTVVPGAAGDSTITLSLDRAFLDAVGVERMMPEPVLTRAAAGLIEFQFRSDGSTHPLEVVFTILPDEIGVQHASLRTAHGSLRLTQRVLP
jgi:hypothetical protein